MKKLLLNLKDLIHKIVHEIFGEKVDIRFRPSYFPFTEPSAEVDISIDSGKWLEILGCGIVNPIVLENCNIDSENLAVLLSDWVLKGLLCLNTK